MLYLLSIYILMLNMSVFLCRSLILKSTWIRSETYWTVKIYLTCKHERAVDEPADCHSCFSVEDKPGCSRGQEQGSFCQGTCSTLIQYTVLYYAVSVLQYHQYCSNNTSCPSGLHRAFCFQS